MKNGQHDGSEGSKDKEEESNVNEEDEALIQLRPNQCKKVQFPPGCPIIYTTFSNHEDAEGDSQSEAFLPTVTYGTVQAAYLHFDTRQIVYKIDSGQGPIFVEESELTFGRKTSVFASLPETPEPVASQILNAYQEPNGTVLYSIQTIASKSICHFIAAEFIKYRPVETDAIDPHDSVLERPSLAQAVSAESETAPAATCEIGTLKDNVLTSFEETSSLTQEEVSVKRDLIDCTDTPKSSIREPINYSGSKVQAHSETTTAVHRNGNQVQDVNTATRASDAVNIVIGEDWLNCAASMRAVNDRIGHGVVVKQQTSVKAGETLLPVLVNLSQPLKTSGSLIPVKGDDRDGSQEKTATVAQAQVPDRDDRHCLASSSKRPASIDDNRNTKRHRWVEGNNSIQCSLLLPKFVSSRLITKADINCTKLGKETNCEIRMIRPCLQYKRAFIAIRGRHRDAIQYAIRRIEDTFVAFLEKDLARQFMYELAKDNPDCFPCRRETQGDEVIVYQREPEKAEGFASSNLWRWMVFILLPSSWDIEGAISLMVGPRGRGITEIKGSLSCFVVVTRPIKPGFFITGQSPHDVEECTQRALQRIEWGKKRYKGPPK